MEKKEKQFVLNVMAQENPLEDYFVEAVIDVMAKVLSL